MVSETDLARLRKTRLFAHLSKDEATQIAESAKTRTYEKGTQLFEEGEDAQHFFAVLSGWIKIFRPTAQGEQAVLGVLGPGETFAEAAIVLGRRYPASAETIEAGRLCLFEREIFEPLIARYPRLGLGMLEAVSHQLHQMTMQVEQLKTRNGEQRLISFLLTLCGCDRGPCRITLPYDKAVVAARLGMRPESLSRHLAQLALVGVTVEGQSVAIGEVGALTDYLAGATLRRRQNRCH